MQIHRGFGHRSATFLLIAVAVTTLGSHSQSRADQERRREEWQRVGDIFRAMEIRPGAIVADVGAGDGFFTSRLATAVGPSGRVFAVDIDDRQLDRLRRRLTEDPHPNVTVVKGTATDPGLPGGMLDAALVVNAYHEMAEHQAMLTAIQQALKRAGRLVLVEPISERRRTVTRAEQTDEHEIAPEFALRDLRAAGFRIIGLEDPFTNRGDTLEWMLTATPATAPASDTVRAPESTAAADDDWRHPGLRMSIEELDTLLRSGAGTVIDVRDQGMFAKGHLPNAVLIPLEEIGASGDRLRGLKRPFVTYCS